VQISKRICDAYVSQFVFMRALSASLDFSADGAANPTSSDAASSSTPPAPLSTSPPAQLSNPAGAPFSSRRSVLVLLLDDLESFAGGTLSDLLHTLARHPQLASIPVALVFGQPIPFFATTCLMHVTITGVATHAQLLHGILRPAAVDLLCIEKFAFQPPRQVYPSSIP